MDIKAKDYQQVSADPNAQKDRPYRMVIGKSGKRWFYVPGKFAATAVYVDGGPGSEGMGGRVCRFNLEDGTYYDSIGPWMTTAENLLNDTGIDITHQYATRLTLCRRVEYPKNHSFRPDMLDVVHHEEEYVEGPYRRADDLAQEIANKLGEKLFYFIESTGGAHSYWVSPKEQTC